MDIGKVPRSRNAYTIRAGLKDTKWCLATINMEIIMVDGCECMKE